MSLFLHTFNVYVCRCDYSAKWLVNLRIFFSLFLFFLSPSICSTDGFGVTLQHLSLCLDWSIMFSLMKMEWRRTFNFMNRRLSPKCIIIALLPVGLSHGGVKIWGGGRRRLNLTVHSVLDEYDSQWTAQELKVHTVIFFLERRSS